MQISGGFKNLIAMEKFPNWQIVMSWPRKQPEYTLRYIVMVLPEPSGMKLMLIPQFMEKEGKTPMGEREMFDGK